MNSSLLLLTGGAMIGLSATLLLLLHGRIAGISGILGLALTPSTPTQERAWRVWFLLGLLAIGAFFGRSWPESFAEGPGSSPWRLIIGGALVGYGTRLGSGCTSGHGVCGISRLSPRSFAATLTFVGFAMLTVTLSRHLGSL
jgi:uncharacterized protein